MDSKNNHTASPASSSAPGCASLQYGDPVEIQTGEMDDPERHRFVMRIGGNGDIYLEVCPQSKRFAPHVHIVTSGGHNTQMPDVTRALFQLYNALYEHSQHNA